MRLSEALHLMRHHFTRVIVAASLVAHGAFAVATCTPNCPPPPSRWMMVHGDETNASYNPNETVLTWTKLQSAVFRWKHDLGFFSPHTLVASSDTVVYASSPSSSLAPDEVTALALGSGQQRWSVQRPHGFDQFFAVAMAYGSRTYMNRDTNGGGLESYDTIKGTAFGGLPGALGTAVVQSASVAAPIAANGMLYYARLDGGVSAVTTTGTAVWALPPIFNRTYLNQLAVGASRVYVTRVVNPGQSLSQSNTVLALDAQTGNLLWSHDFPSTQFVSPPVYQQGSIYLKTRTLINSIFTAANAIVRLDAATGVQMASTALLGVPLTNLAAVDQSPTVGAGRVMAQGMSGDFQNPHSIIVLDAITLARKWERTLKGSTDGLYDFTRAPTIASDFVVACTGGVLRAWQIVDASEGLFNLSTLNCTGQPIVAGGTLVYFSSGNYGVLQVTALTPAGP